jgi:bis(5'-nucleosyl)-tetraphosphatase (symmetrical)
MATWAIGDLHGCFDAFQRLLERIRFDPGRDRLWLVGDLVNRGPDSLACLRAVRDLGEAAVCVPGNHDLHLLARAAGARASKQKDTFDDVLRAPDRAELLDWLRWRPMLHRDPALGFTLVHAGLHPHWDLAPHRHWPTRSRPSCGAPTTPACSTTCTATSPCSGRPI